MIDQDPSEHPEPAIPIEQAREIRRFSHDLSNALEIIIQTSFLLGTIDLPEDGKQWLALLDKGVQQGATINTNLREYIRNNS